MARSLSSGRPRLKRCDTTVCLPSLPAGDAQPMSMRPRHLVRVVWAVASVAAGMIGAATASAPALSAQQTPAPPKPVEIRIADSTQVQVIRLRDGSSIVGRVTEIGADTIRFETTAGVLTFARAD